MPHCSLPRSHRADRPPRLRRATRQTGRSGRRQPARRESSLACGVPWRRGPAPRRRQPGTHWGRVVSWRFPKLSEFLRVRNCVWEGAAAFWRFAIILADSDLTTSERSRGLTHWLPGSETGRGGACYHMTDASQSRAAIATFQADFPLFAFAPQRPWSGLCVAAVRRNDAEALHTIVSDDLTEVRTELSHASESASGHGPKTAPRAVFYGKSP